MITPVAATTAHQRFAMKVPSNDRNSPTNPLRPGRPIDASITTVKTPGEPRRDLLEPAELGDLVGVAALVEDSRAG